jgi:uncharacterized protein
MILDPVRRILERANGVFKRAYFGRGKSFVASKLSEAEPEWIPIALNPGDVNDGNPQVRLAPLNESPDKGMATGLWDCTAGKLRCLFLCDEVVHILEGDVIVTAGPLVHHLRVGDVAYFPIGTNTEWNVSHYVKKLYFQRDPTPIVNSLLRM